MPLLLEKHFTFSCRYSADGVQIMAIESGSRLIKTLIFGVVSVILYWALIHYSKDISHFALTTADVCMVGEGHDAQYFQKATAEACALKGGVMQKGNWLFVLIPIFIAFVLSYVHGAFTGLFWDVVGLKAKK
jgi:hypothetical protein